MSVERLYALEGRDRVARRPAGHRASTMPVFPKRRFQHGALPAADRAPVLVFRGRITEPILPRFTNERDSAAPYPGAADRARPLDTRPSRAAQRGRSSRAVAAFVERGATERGGIAPIATLFLANRECPWRCLMCDLWKNTTLESRAARAPSRPRSAALAALASGRGASSSTTRGASSIPGRDPAGGLRGDRRRSSGFERVIVESHPALSASARYDGCAIFCDGDLEVAMGLETAHPEVLPSAQQDA